MLRGLLRRLGTRCHCRPLRPHLSRWSSLSTVHAPCTRLRPSTRASTHPSLSTTRRARPSISFVIRCWLRSPLCVISLDAQTLIRDLSCEAPFLVLICRSMPRCPYVNRLARPRLFCVIRCPLCGMRGDQRTLNRVSKLFERCRPSESGLYIP